MRLCSACLLGIRCRWDGKSKPNEKVLALAKKEVLIPVCPEQLAGMPTPRMPAEIQRGDGKGVWSGKAKVLQRDGNDVTESFQKGAEEVLQLANRLGIREAILKQRSPSCGSGQSYDGTFSKTIVKGDGVAAALLKKNGIRVVPEEELS